MLNRLSNRAIVKVAALVVVLLATLLLASTISAQEARSYRYRENGTDPIATFRATTDVNWTVGGVDAADFEISDSGALSFRSSPNFENPTDRQHDEDGDGTTDGDEGKGNNIHKVDVVADGTVLVNATVTVTDVDDAGVVTLSHLQPAEGVLFEADASDEDDGLRNTDDKLWEAGETSAPMEGADGAPPRYARWKWEKSQSGTSGWSVIPDKTESSYTPATADVGFYLRVTATYSDRDLVTADAVSNAPIRTASKVSDYSVKAADNQNQTPAFADDGTDTGKQQDRKVNENSDAGSVVGPPVRAQDTDVLTYQWTTATDAATTAAFNVDKATGQISVKGDLDHETTGKYTGIVLAKDPYGSSDEVTVTIEVADVNDAPEFTDAVTTLRVAENDATHAFVDDTGTAADIDDNNYVATDEDDGEDVASYSVIGPDAGPFEISAAGALTFDANAAAADFETKNSYSVTIVATDDRNKSVSVDVTIKVNDAEDVGTITLSTRQPQVGRSLTATLTDQDGVEGNIVWLWQKIDAIDTSGVFSCPTTGYTEVDTAGDNEDRDEKQTFTPLAEDVNTGMDNAFKAVCLQVVATYNDGFGSNDDTVDVETANPVLQQRAANSAPVFEDQDPDTEEIENDSATRTVGEDADNGDPVGRALTANDSDKDIGVDNLNDMPTYTLHGADAASFKIDDDSGQIRRSAPLDYETKNTHSVIVRATDGSQAIADIAVTIMVTDVNEAPEISGPASVDFEENDSSPVATYTADDPEGNTFTWSLSGSDASLLEIGPTSGVLSFKSPPNFEDRRDNGSGSDGIYEVTVVATDTADQEDMKAVEITVTNMPDPARIILSVVQPGVGVPVTATLKDDDTADEEGAATYQWARADSADGAYADIDNATSGMYTPGESDGGKYLQVTATYGPFDGKKSVSASFVYPVEARDVANPVPVFPDQNPDTTDKDTDQEREVPENSPRGTFVGAPVTADDDDVITYSVHTDTVIAADYSDFTIDKATGQLKVGGVDSLNFEASDVYDVMVTATDANGATATVNVKIIAANVDEKPSLDRPAAGAADDELEANEGRQTIDADPAAGGDQAALYESEDPEGDDVTWSVEGADGDKFTITGGTLAFKSAPDYEAKASASGTNKYRVTIVASDESGNRATRGVKVNVKNVNESGKITMSTVQPQVGVPLTATLSEPDEVVGSVTWTWAIGGTDADPNVGSSTNSFTPTGTGILTVVVSYKDGQGGDTVREIAATDPNDQVDNTYNIREKQTSNSRPRFEDGEGAEITNTLKEVAENTEAGEPVGSTVDAEDTDPNAELAGKTNRLTYTMSGPDAASFTIVRGEPAGNGVFTAATTAGQIQTKADLDYETKNVYMVTVTATDGSGASASIDVTINVTDVTNEPPVLAPANEAPEFAGATATREVAEDAAVGAAVGDPVAATDADADTLTYSISGDSFTIDSGTGQIMLGAELDYETTSSYTVTVTADDGNGGTASVEVAIMVTDVDEDGSITFDITQLSIGTPITATLTDPDGGVTNVTWMWERVDGQGTATVIAGAVSATYMPVNADGGHDLKVTASYDDRQGTGKSAAGTAGEVPEMPSYDADADGDGMISRDEAITAVQDYFRNEITRDQVLAVIAEYFAGLSS